MSAPAAVLACDALLDEVGPHCERARQRVLEVLLALTLAQRDGVGFRLVDRALYRRKSAARVGAEGVGRRGLRPEAARGHHQKDRHCDVRGSPVMPYRDATPRVSIRPISAAYRPREFRTLNTVELDANGVPVAVKLVRVPSPGARGGRPAGSTSWPEGAPPLPSLELPKTKTLHEHAADAYGPYGHIDFEGIRGPGASAGRLRRRDAGARV